MSGTAGPRCSETDQRAATRKGVVVSGQFCGLTNRPARTLAQKDGGASL